MLKLETDRRPGNDGDADQDWSQAGLTNETATALADDLDEALSAEESPPAEADTRYSPPPASGPRRGEKPQAPDPLAAYYATGEHEYFEQFYRQECRLAWAVAYRMLGNAADAADAVNDAFADFAGSRKPYDPHHANAHSYFTTAVVNRARNILRRKHTARTINMSSIELGDGEPGLAEQLHSAKDEPFYRCALDESARGVRQALSELPPVPRQIVTLFYQEGLSYKEIAALLDIPMGTVKSRLNAAIARLALKTKAADEEILNGPKSFGPEKFRKIG